MGLTLMSNEPNKGASREDEYAEADRGSQDEGMGGFDDHPYRGEELGGATAEVCAGFDPDPLRFAYYQPAMRILIIFLVVVAALAAGAFGGGYALHAPGGGWWPGILAAACYMVGAFLVFVGLLALLFLVMGYNSSAKYFKSALLTPAVVVEEKPLVLVALAPLGDGSGPGYSGLRRVDLYSSGLPVHPHKRGERVPCVSAFERGEGLDRWVCFLPEPISWGTGSRKLIEQCLGRLEDKDFDRLDAFIAQGLTPKDDELILLDEEGRRLDTLSISAEKEKYRAQQGA